MKLKFTLFTVLTSLALAGCTANPAPDGTKSGNESVYSQHGMEVSKIASQMADTLADTLKNKLMQEARAEADERHALTAQKPTYPKVAVMSFVDTDTYENAGHLGRQLGEFFIHELDRRSIPVVEFKTTGTITVSKDGEIIFSRDWKKLASQAKIRHVLAGTISRNEKGVVLVGRIIDMATSDVKGSATGFVAYKYLPYCYRTAEKNCSFEGTLSYSTYMAAGSGTATGSKNVKTVAASGTTIVPTTSSSTRHEIVQERKAREKLQHDADFNDKYYPTGAKVPATSTGNYEQFIHGKGSMFGHSSVIYPADSYRFQGQLVRDVHDQSQYQRIEDN